MGSGQQEQQGRGTLSFLSMALLFSNLAWHFMCAFPLRVHIMLSVRTSRPWTSSPSPASVCPSSAHLDPLAVPFTGSWVP